MEATTKSNHKIHHSEYQHLLRMQAHDCDHSLDSTTPFGAALPLGIPMTVNNDPKFDCYLDNIFGAFLAENADHAVAVAERVDSVRLLSSTWRIVSHYFPLPEE